MARRPSLIEPAAQLPEADRLEPYPHPRDTAVLLGQAHAEAQVLSGLAANRLHHGLLITGAEGVGKATFAYALARYLMAQPHERSAPGLSLDVRPQTPTSRLVAARSHPSLLVITRTYDPKTKRFSASIPVDEVRKTRNFLSLSGDEHSYRVVIVDQADELNTSAANALLKSLEEPPAQTIFMLLSAEPGRLLPTLRSRCRRLELAPLGAEDLLKAANAAQAAGGETHVALDKAERLIRLAHGSVRRFLMLATDDGVKLHDAVDNLLHALPKVDWVAMHTLADSLSGAAQETRFLRFVDLMLAALARLIKARATLEDAPDVVAKARSLMGEDKLPLFAAVWEDIARDKALTLAINLDRKAFLLKVASRLEAAAR